MLGFWNSARVCDALLRQGQVVAQEPEKSGGIQELLCRSSGSGWPGQWEVFPRFSDLSAILLLEVTQEVVELV